MKINTEKLYQAFIYIIVGLLVLMCVFPLIYVIGMSLTTEQEFIARGNLMIWPHDPSLGGYKKVLFNTNTYIKGLGVSVLRVIVGVSFQMVCNIILGYMLSKKDLPGGKILSIAVMITVLYGGGLIPSFITVSGLGLLDSFWAMIIPGLVDSWSVLVFKQFFCGLPNNVLESAEIDGCSETRKLTDIVLPMSKPVMASLGLFSAVGHWNSWFDAVIYLPSNREWYPLQLLLRNMLTSSNIGTDFDTSVLVERVTQTPTTLRMVVVVVGTLPILCVYPFLQKYFTAGVYTGAVKE